MMMRMMVLVLFGVLLAVVPSMAVAPYSASVADFGAKGDGLADDTVAIQRALDAVASKGGVANLPAGSYLISAALSVPHGVTLLGEGARWEGSATKLIVPKNGYSAIKLNHGSSVKGLGIIYPSNRNNAHPVAYPPSILLEGINPSVENIVFDCAWIGISTPPGGGNSGQGMFKEITGFVHHVGIHLSGCRDVNRIIDVHWFVGGENSEEPAYYGRNRVGFEFGDVDGLIMDRCFMIGGKTFFHQLPQKDAPDGKKEAAHSLGHHINLCWIEDVEKGFVFEGMTGFVLSSTNILVREGGVGVSVIPQSLYYNGVISGVQVRTFGKPAAGIEFDPKTPHGRNRLSISDCQVVDGAPAIRLGPGARRVNLHDNHLQAVAGQAAVLIEKGADLLVVTNNVLTGGTGIKDGSGKKAQKTITGNLVEK
ncbi:MAG: glycosyl hydrolase family 28-related protein [Armatimonadota bacterium]